MDGYALHNVKGCGPEPVIYAGSFQCNGTSDPSSTTYEYPPGFPFTVTYSATGVFTVTLPSGFVLPDQPYSIQVTPQFSELANYFAVGVLGETTLNTTTRQFVIQAHRAGTGEAPTNTAGNRINFAIHATNSTGR